MKFVFIVNPLAGVPGNESRIREAVSRLPEREDCEILLTAAAGDGTRLVRRWASAHPGEPVRFIACGGDGTISEVFNGAAGLAGASVTCCPCGSGNDFVKTFGGAERFSDVEKLIHAPTRKLDLLQVGDRYAANAVHFGLDAAVADMVNEERAKKGRGGKSAYAKAVVLALVREMRHEFTVTADGEVLNPDGKALLCTVANGQYVGGSFQCAPRARTDDGLMEVCLVKPVSRLRFLRKVGAYMRGTHLDDPTMRDMLVYRRARRVEVSAPAGFRYAMDGEIIREDRFVVEMAAGALDLAVPERPGADGAVLLGQNSL